MTRPFRGAHAQIRQPHQAAEVRRDAAAGELVVSEVAAQNFACDSVFSRRNMCPLRGTHRYVKPVKLAKVDHGMLPVSLSANLRSLPTHATCGPLSIAP